MTLIDSLLIIFIITSLVIGLVVLLLTTNLIGLPNPAAYKIVYSALVICLLFFVLTLFAKALFVYYENAKDVDECKKANPPFWCELGE